MIKTILAGVLVFLALATAGDKSTLKQLYDQRRRFELRDAIQDHDVPTLCRIAVRLHLQPIAALFER